MEELPKEVFVKMIRYMDLQERFENCASVCKHWKNVIYKTPIDVAIALGENEIPTQALPHVGPLVRKLFTFENCWPILQKDRPDFTPEALFQTVYSFTNLKRLYLDDFDQYDDGVDTEKLVWAYHCLLKENQHSLTRMIFSNASCDARLLFYNLIFPKMTHCCFNTYEDPYEDEETKSFLMRISRTFPNIEYFVIDVCDSNECKYENDIALRMMNCTDPDVKANATVDVVVNGILIKDGKLFNHYEFDVFDDTSEPYTTSGVIEEF